VVGAQQRRVQVCRPIQLGGAEQFQAVVVDRNGKRHRLPLADAPGQQAGESQVNLASGEWIQEQVPTFPGFEGFGQQRALRGQTGPAQLRAQHGLRRLHFRAVEMTGGGFAQARHDSCGELAGKRHAPTVPARYGGFLRLAAPHVGGHVLHPDQL
jgi:hypothetical protein